MHIIDGIEYVGDDFSVLSGICTGALLKLSLCFKFQMSDLIFHQALTIVPTLHLCRSGYF